MNEEIVIRTCSENELDSLYKLYQRCDETTYHFTKPYTKELLSEFVKNKKVSVALHNQRVVSFYFLNAIHDVGTLQLRINKINELIETQILPSGTYAYTLLAGTDEDYLRRGLNRDTLNHLKNLVKEEYDFFCGFPYKTLDASIESSKKMGWKYFGDAGFGLIAITGTTEEKNNVLDEYLAKNNLTK